MFQIDRNALVQSNLTGGASKCSSASSGVDTKPKNTTTVSSVVIVNGQVVVSETPTFPSGASS